MLNVVQRLLIPARSGIILAVTALTRAGNESYTITAPYAYQIHGIGFSASEALHTLTPQVSTPSFTFTTSTGRPLMDAPWKDAEILATGGEHIPQINLRRIGDAFLYRASRFHLFQLEGQTMIGFNPARTDPVPFELEFLESGVSLYLEREGVPVLHGAAVEVEGKAILLIANSQSGKSSLTIGLLKAGYSLISDDIIPIMSDYVIEPGHGYLRMWQDTAEALLDQHLTRPLFPRAPKSKRVTDVRSWGKLAASVTPIAGIYVVNANPHQIDIQIEQLTGFSAVNTLLLHSPMLAMHGSSIREGRMSYFAEMLSSIPLKVIRYPRSYDQLPAAVDALLQDVQDHHR